MKILFLLRNLSLRTRLIVTFIVLITIPLVIFGVRYYTISKNVISDIVQRNVYELVKKNNEIIDTKLYQVTENILSFTIDKDLYSAFATIKPNNDYNIKLLGDQVSKVMNKYFAHSLDIYSAQLATSYYTFGSTTSLNTGSGKNFIPAGGFTGTKLYQIANEKDGKLQWVPTYDFSDMFKVNYMKNVNIDYRYLFSAVQLINGSYFDGVDYNTFADDIEKPVLIVNFKEDFFQKAFRNSIPIKGSYFLVVSKEGKLIAHQDEDELANQSPLPWVNDLITKGSGTELIKINGQNRIVCFDTSMVTGWLSVVVIPPESLIGEILTTTKTYIIVLAFILILISIFISLFITRRITNPLQKVMKAFKKTGEGNFNLYIQEEGSNEMRVLIQRFNEMNEKIQILIDENYEIAIKEKEAEITALNLQLDPHFMYNTLNLINLISIENNQDEISEMIVSLSTMLKYTVKSSKELVTFKQDFEYLQSYIFIMTKRFEGRYQIEYNIAPDLFAFGVPKFFMQPFVENVFVHAFDSFKQRGLLKISCWIEGDIRFFCIEDNGKGIQQEQLAKLLHPDQNSIGIYNVHKRIKIIYGDNYGIQIESVPDFGTKVTIELPKD
ncbi:sensor histidine kinase [Paenibacillus sp. Soil787]|uniref:sensor histidine kinase n=1 Tax=Paenibacillus sp. Soil787 TaxID=1736411 RepID=UPI00138F465A|nr:histidine kinase [Paenibacillus sp. Soil787]